MLCSCVKVLLLIVSLRLGRGQETINKAFNESITFNLKSLDGVSEITWKFGLDKLAELDGLSEPHIYPSGNRISVTFSPGSLTINLLHKGDMGTYTAEIQVGRETRTVTFILNVYDVVQRPHVTCTREDDPNTLVLHCHSSGEVEYRWRNSSGSIVSDQQNLTVTDPSLYKNGNVTCDAHNPGSSKSNFILLSSCDQKGKYRSHGYIFAVVAGVIALLISLWILYKKGKLPKCHRGEEPKPKEPETERLRSQNVEKKSPDVTLVNIRKLPGDGGL